MINPSMYVKFSYMNSSADLNGDDGEGEDKDEDEDEDDDEDESKEKEEGSESILKFIYLLYSFEFVER